MPQPEGLPNNWEPQEGQHYIISCPEDVYWKSTFKCYQEGAIVQVTKVEGTVYKFHFVDGSDCPCGKNWHGLARDDFRAVFTPLMIKEAT